MTETSPCSPYLVAYIDPLLAGDRAACRQTIEAATAAGISSCELLTGMIWPAMEHIQMLFREDRISQTSLNLATRLNRSLTDQIAGRLEHKPSIGAVP